MIDFHHPFVVFAIALVAQCIAAYAGHLLRVGTRALNEDEREDFDVVRTATLTLLALIIGFSFSMAITRYDQRKTYEETEANAIGTEYVRADLLPAADAARVRELLRKYLDRRIAFYLERGGDSPAQLNAETAKLQAELWSSILPVANAQPTPVVALVVSGMNDVLNAQGYARADFWDRIPFGAWAMMALIALAANLMVGYGARRTSALLLVLPIIVSSAFLLIADIDSPRVGFVRVDPQNLTVLSRSIAR